MLDTLYKLFTEQLKLAADYWLYVFIGLTGLGFIVALVAGLVGGRFNKIKSVMKTVVAKPDAHVAAMKKMPVAVKAQYKNARLGNLKPSMLVTEQMCVDEPFKHSIVSRIWLVTLVVTAVSATLCYLIMPFAQVEITDVDNISAVASVAYYPYLGTISVVLVGGLLALIGAIVGKCVYNGAVSTYSKFVTVIDGDLKAAAQEQPVYEQPQQNYDAGAQMYAEQPQQYEEQPQPYEPEQVYAEPRQEYAEPQQSYAEPQYEAQAPVYENSAVVTEPQESDEEIRRRAREEALARQRAEQQAAEAQRQQQQQQAATQRTSADDVIARIEQIDRDGAPRETMREVATLLQKERVKPENKTPEQQKKLNEALSKLLKAMSAASRK